MLVSANLVKELYEYFGEAKYNRAINFTKQKKVSIQNVVYEGKNDFELTGKVIGDTGTFKTYIRIKDGEIENAECSCEEYKKNYGTCMHILATILEFDTKPEYQEKYAKNTNMENKVEETIKIGTRDRYRNFKQVLNAFYNDTKTEEEKKDQIIVEHNNIKIIPKFIFDRFYKEMKIEFKLGINKFYKIKNIEEFYERMLNNENYKYGTKLEFIHCREAFDKDSWGLLDFIIKYGEIIKYVNNNGETSHMYYGKTLNSGSIILSNSGLDEIFEILKGNKVELQSDYLEDSLTLVPNNPEIKFKLEKSDKNEYKIVPEFEINEYYLLEGREYSYILIDDCLYRCNKDFKNGVFKLLEIYRKNFIREICFSKKQLPEFFSLLMPKIKNSIEIDEKNIDELKTYIPSHLNIKVYLDFDKNNYIISELKFCYEELEFNPLDDTKVTIARNILKENEIFEALRKSGFMLDMAKKRFVLTNDDAIYEFLSNDIEKYMRRFEVLVTDNFKSKEIRTSNLGSIGVKVENNLLNIDLTGMQFDRNELKEVLEKYNLKKKYHRLKDGSFIELENNPEIEFLNSLEAGMNIDEKDLQKGKLSVPVYRSMYLNKLLEKIKGIEINKNTEYNNLVSNINNKYLDEEIELPKTLNGTLRYYQRTGYKWLKILEYYGMGGVLADDMGLGKTIQLLSVILSYVEVTNKEERLPSIVISPSSLALNWLNESNKFAKDLRVLVISGKADERKRKIESINEYDLIITSYDSLKRDIEIYEKMQYKFKYSIADEAQYIKNSNTQNAKALKSINAEVRYALTGTPIENSLAELWSIFDYIMPGYLFSYRKFKQVYELPIIKENNESAINKLKMLIEPFILRRIKKDVLKELPDKSITILNNEMEEEQQKVYMSYLSQAKTEALKEINANGVEKSQIKILALLTRLRQICCHPSLFIENYKGESSKLNQCVEIVKDGVESGHKILLFSGYTSMFEILEKELNSNNIKYYKLTGQTKVDERMKMVDDFNENKDIKVFLISLKAGGTGLNLTGADMVIHYDPWWNISAENQATDRAYRIGQKNNVQVYKLITKNSIEERIFELQEKKSKLIDNMLSTPTTFISKLTKEDIMGLFS